MTKIKVMLYVNGVGVPIPMHVSSTNSAETIIKEIGRFANKNAASLFLCEHNDAEKVRIAIGPELGQDGTEFDVFGPDAGEYARLASDSSDVGETRVFSSRMHVQRATCITGPYLTLVYVFRLL